MASSEEVGNFVLSEKPADLASSIPDDRKIGKNDEPRIDIIGMVLLKSTSFTNRRARHGKFKNYSVEVYAADSVTDNICATYNIETYHELWDDLRIGEWYEMICVPARRSDKSDKLWLKLVVLHSRDAKIEMLNEFLARDLTELVIGYAFPSILGTSARRDLKKMKNSTHIST